MTPISEQEEPDFNRFSLEPEVDSSEDDHFNDAYQLKKKVRFLRSKIANKEEVLEELNEKRGSLIEQLDELKGTNRDLKKEKNFWKKECKEAMEKLDRLQRKSENYQKTSEDLINKNNKLRIRFQNYNIEIERLKNRIKTLEG